MSNIAATLPVGTVTFLFTDIEGSTPLWERHPEGMKTALARHDNLLRQAIESQQGVVIKTTGDGFHAVFASAQQGVAAAVAGQRLLQAESWGETGALKVRMGLHSGEAELRQSDYFGPAPNRAARVMSIGYGGQILLSEVTAQLAREHLPTALSLLDLGEHQLKGLAHPEHIFQLVAADLPVKFPALYSSAVTHSNLPVQLTSFIGRTKELAEIKALLGSERLVTLTGPGGTGKTRLALEIAAEVLPDYPDGAWLLELAPLADPAFILPALAAIFGLREQPGRSLLTVATDYLHSKSLVLLLDNCEHLIEACARLADELLHACPRLKIIASSREALGLAGETTYRVPSLALPDLHSLTPETLARSEAVLLFVERARAAQPHFTLTTSNAPAVAAICTRLDGIPLALELAAARVKLLAAEQIAARLDDRFRLLVGGSRTALPRQQTLRALIDWSYDLLPEDERMLLRQMSVFAGGATLEAAEAVGAELDVLGVLAQLVNKSLVAMEEQGPAARYRLLETIRQYAREKLLESGEAADARARHLDLFLRLAEAAWPRLIGAEMIACLDELEAEQDNLRAALEWGLESDPLAALRMAAALYIFWGRRTSLAEGLDWVRSALTRAEATSFKGESEQTYLAARAKALSGEATLAFALGDYLAAWAATEASAALARRIGASQTLALALGMGATISGFLGDIATARAWAEETIAVCRQHGYDYELSVISGVYGFLEGYTDQPLPPEVQQESLQAARRSGNPWMIALAIQNVARLAAYRGEFAEACAGFAEAAVLYQSLRDQHFYYSSRSDLGHVLRKQGRYEEAAAVYGETIRYWQESGSHAALAHELESFALIAVAKGQADRAARLCGAAEALRESLGSDMTPIERREYDTAVAQLRAQMDERALQAAWANGRVLTIEQAIKLAVTPG